MTDSWERKEERDRERELERGVKLEKKWWGGGRGGGSGGGQRRPVQEWKRTDAVHRFTSAGRAVQCVSSSTLLCLHPTAFSARNKKRRKQKSNVTQIRRTKNISVFLEERERGGVDSPGSVSRQQVERQEAAV